VKAMSPEEARAAQAAAGQPPAAKD
jgi:hypothetical protein